MTEPRFHAPLVLGTLGRGLGWGVVALGLLAASQGACASPAEEEAAPAVELRGVYRPTTDGLVGALEFGEDHQYRLWRNSATPCPSLGTDPNACAEKGRFELTADALTLVDERTGERTSFGFRAQQSAATEGSPSLTRSAAVAIRGAGVNLAPGGGAALTPGGGRSLVASAVYLTGPDGGGQPLVLVGGPSILVSCGHRIGDSIQTMVQPCGSTLSNCTNGPRIGKPPLGIGQGFCP